MRKWMILFFVVLTFWLPTRVNAVKLSNFGISGRTIYDTGEEFTITATFKFDDIVMDTASTSGIYALYFNLQFDDDVLIFLNATSDTFDMYGNDNGDGNYDVIGLIVDNLGSVHSCAEGKLFCYNEAQIKLSFYVRDTTKTTSTIQFMEPSVVVAHLDKIEDNPDELDDDFLEELTGSNVTHNLTIKKTKVTTKEPTSNLQSGSTIQTPSKNEVTKKSNNADLKSLTIENHHVSFNKDKTEYNLYVKDDANTLKITTATADSKAKYEIIGDTDLKAHNDQVQIIVTAEDGTKKTYNINVERKDPINEEEQNTKKDKGIDNRIFIYVGIGLGIIFILWLIFFIKGKINDHKLNKMLDKI